MIQGVIEENKPLVPVEIGWLHGAQQVSVLVDTGFTGDLKISYLQAKQLGLETSYAGDVLLANDQEVVMDGAFAFISIEGITKVVNVLVSKGEAIIGVELLRKFGYELRMNTRINRLVLEA